MENQQVINNQLPPIPSEQKPHSFLTNKLFLISLAVMIIFTFIYAGIYLNLNSQLNQILSTFKFTDQKDQVVCTQDAKLCPDGSYVSRQPPNCEFAACPQN